MQGVGEDAELHTNSNGGRQSKVNYRFDLLPPLALASVAEVLAYGCEKYGEDNLKLIKPSEHLNHALIHINAYRAGDTQDNHAGHAAARIMLWLESVLSEKEPEQIVDQDIDGSDTVTPTAKGMDFVERLYSMNPIITHKSKSAVTLDSSRDGHFRGFGANGFNVPPE